MNWEEELFKTFSLKWNFFFFYFGLRRRMNWWVKGTTFYMKNEHSTTTNKNYNNRLVCHEKVFFCLRNFREPEKRKKWNLFICRNKGTTQKKKTIIFLLMICSISHLKLFYLLLFWFLLFHLLELRCFT